MTLLLLLIGMYFSHKNERLFYRNSDGYRLLRKNASGNYSRDDRVYRYQPGWRLLLGQFSVIRADARFNEYHQGKVCSQVRQGRVGCTIQLFGVGV